jgi:hypothetical protein
MAFRTTVTNSLSREFITGDFIASCLVSCISKFQQTLGNHCFWRFGYSDRLSLRNLHEYIRWNSFSRYNSKYRVADYLHVREQIGDSELIRHFPPTVPDNATNVKFAYFGGFMQSGAYIQLRLQLPQDEIAKLSKEYHSKAKYMFIGGNKSDHANKPDGVPTTNFYTGDTEDGSFPENYETLVLNAKPEGTSDFKWNHGQSYGVVISLENSEIIYWAEDW